jgi:hypothetical protein
MKTEGKVMDINTFTSKKGQPINVLILATSGGVFKCLTDDSKTPMIGTDIEVEWDALRPNAPSPFVKIT